MILSEEQEIIREHANLLGISFDEMKRLVANLITEISSVWDAFQGLLNQSLINIDNLLVNERPGWNTPKKQMLRNQVLNRKPLMARARSSC